MATGAGLAEWEQTHGKKKAKYVLTSTGLLMEGPWINAMRHPALYGTMSNVVIA
jgi:hypothetical protein